MKICPNCGGRYEDSVTYCTMDGQLLLTGPKPAAGLVGTIISNKYRVLEKLGAGGMGSVYLAEQINLGNRPVALKLLQQQLLANEEILQRFKNEAFTVGQLSHPNIVTIYEMEQTGDGELYIAMEYVRGASLRQLIEKERIITPLRTVNICKQVSRALGEAHRKGIIHRDIKPDNIMVLAMEDGEDQIKVLDFGIAKLKEGASSKTQTGMVLGTPRYMSYEQASGMSSTQLDARSDIYSLGVVMYEMLTGAAPFDAETPMGTILKHIKDIPRPMLEFRPDLLLPKDLDALVLRCLSKDRELRHATARELAIDLERIETSLRIKGRPPAVERGTAAADKTSMVSEELLSLAAQAATTPPPQKITRPVTAAPVMPQPRPPTIQPPTPQPPSQLSQQIRPKPPQRVVAPPVREKSSVLGWVAVAAVLTAFAAGGYYYVTSRSQSLEQTTSSVAGPKAPAPVATQPPIETKSAPIASSEKSTPESTPVVETKTAPALPPATPISKEPVSGGGKTQNASLDKSKAARPGFAPEPTGAAAPQENIGIAAGQERAISGTPSPGGVFPSIPVQSQRFAGGSGVMPSVDPGAANRSGSSPGGPQNPTTVAGSGVPFPKSDAPAQGYQKKPATLIDDVPSGKSMGAAVEAPPVTGRPAGGGYTDVAPPNPPGAPAVNPTELMTLAQAQLAQRNYDAAINSFSRAAKIKPDLLAESLEGLTQAYEASGRYSEALQSCKQLAEMRPNSGPLHSRLAYFYALQGSAAEATLEHRKAMQYANETYFLVQHGHNQAFTDYCSGHLVVKPGGVEYISANSADRIKLNKKALQDVVQSSYGFQAQIKSKNPISFRFASQKGQEMSVFFRIISEVLR